MVVLLLALLLIAFITGLWLNSLVATYGVARHTAEGWTMVAAGWEMIGALWLPLLLLGVVVLLLGAGLGALLRPAADQAQGRLQARWDEARRQELAETRHRLGETQAALKQAQERLRAFQTLEARERAATQREAELTARGQRIEAHVRTIKAEVREQAEARRAEILAEAQGIRDHTHERARQISQLEDRWRATLTANQRHLEAARAALAYAGKHARRLSQEFQFAQREGREPNLPLIRKEARRLVRALTHPQEIPDDEQESSSVR